MYQVSNDAKVYYKDKYWNDHPFTLEYFIRMLANGRSSVSSWWPEYVAKTYLHDRPPGRALILNCGNGWVERELFDLDCFREAVAFDYSEELLEQANKSKGNRPIKYFQADCNKVEFEPDEFDIVFNVASLHHVQYLNRMLRILAQSLKPGGLFINFDYIGPHRNQYRKDIWELMEVVNGTLPLGLRNVDFTPPDLDTMLKMDPTEAIHSELTMEYFERYFFTTERIDLNGAIAYQLMHNNRELFEDNEICNNAVRYLLKADELSSHVSKLPPLFSFWVGEPKKFVLLCSNKLKAWQDEEDQRELLAAKNDGKYY